jgi:periplasmic divalent cation tolerance protein
MEKLLVAICSVPNEETAKALSQSILEARLAACVSRLPGVQSQYWWQGVLETAEETLLIIKTTALQVDALKAHIQKNHPYETPELLFLGVESYLEAYGQWVKREARPY